MKYFFDLTVMNGHNPAEVTVTTWCHHLRFPLTQWPKAKSLACCDKQI